MVIFMEKRKFWFWNFFWSNLPFLWKSRFCKNGDRSLHQNLILGYKWKVQVQTKFLGLVPEGLFSVASTTFSKWTFLDLFLGVWGVKRHPRGKFLKKTPIIFVNRVLWVIFHLHFRPFHQKNCYWVAIFEGTWLGFQSVWFSYKMVWNADEKSPIIHD